MTRDQAIDAYRRTRAWEESASQRLREQVLVPHFGGCDLIRHNFLVSLSYGKPWACYTPEKARLARYYEWKQRQIWDTAKRLQDAFAKHF